MEITQLEFFVSVIEEGGFSRAAERVYRTQPAVSIAVRRLEEEVGAPLFDRSLKSLTLTEAGQVVYEYAQRILSLRDQAREAVTELRTLKRGRVRVGANESTSLYLLPDAILSFREQHPGVKVEIFRHTSARLPREVMDGNLDFALTAYEPDEGDLEGFRVLEDRLVLVTPPSHRLAGRGPVHIKELGGESFLAHNVRAASRNKVVETFAEHHTPLNITLELATIETIKRFVLKQVGIAFVPHMCVAEELEQGTLAEVPVEELDYRRTIWAIRRRGDISSHAAEAFLQLLRKRK
jgi:DNA-binding transcriptional LysR family regulator